MADKSQIIDAIEALAVHCRPPIMEVGQREMWMRDWCTDLGEFPAEAIGNACRKWRHSGATKFPTPGQLLPLVRDSLPAESRERVGDWRPLSDDEYRQLSIREKIRHHLILAHEAGAKAGPMFRNTSVNSQMAKAAGAHLTLDEMPATYAPWKADEARHMAEVKRLRLILKTPMAAE